MQNILRKASEENLDEVAAEVIKYLYNFPGPIGDDLRVLAWHATTANQLKSLGGMPDENVKKVAAVFRKKDARQRNELLRDCWAARAAHISKRKLDDPELRVGDGTLYRAMELEAASAIQIRKRVRVHVAVGQRARSKTLITLPGPGTITIADMRARFPRFSAVFDGENTENTLEYLFYFDKETGAYEIRDNDALAEVTEMLLADMQHTQKQELRPQLTAQQVDKFHEDIAEIRRGVAWLNGAPPVEHIDIPME